MRNCWNWNRNECVAEVEAREKETALKGKELPRKSSEACEDLNKLLKRFESMDRDTGRFSLIQRMAFSSLGPMDQELEGRPGRY